MMFITASGQSFAAGRDIIINIDGLSTAQVRSIVEQVLVEKTGLPAARIRLQSKSKLRLEDMGEFTNRVTALSFVQSDENRSKFRDYAAEYQRQSETLAKVGRLFKGVDQALKKKEFSRAHRLLGKLLDVEGLTAEKDDIVENYLMSGYVSQANAGNTAGMLLLIEEANQKFFGSINEGIEYLLIEVQQEIATRQEDTSLLENNERLLLDFLRRKGIAPEQSGLLGLLYRRLGERGSVAYLHKAEEIYRGIQQSRVQLNVEEANNFGIALIRDFELTRNAAKLDEALGVLTAIDFKKSEHPLPDYLSLPKALNNIGNVYKQKLSFTGQPEFYTQAVESYAQAEQYWSEATAPYEWAMLQKNKAETRFEYFHISGNQAALQVAATEITASLKYRTEAQAPYQFAKSMAVKVKIDQALRRVESP